MRIETKKLSEKDYEDLLNFGWEINKKITEKQEKTGKEICTYLLSRDKGIAHYAALLALENRYMNYKKQLKVYESSKLEYCILFFCLCVVPLFMYIKHKSDEKKEITAHNAKIQKEMDKLILQAKKYLETKI